jgi:hypothetical protein
MHTPTSNEPSRTPLMTYTNWQAEVRYLQHRLEDAKSEALHALENYEESGAAVDAEIRRALLQKVEQAMDNRSVSF